MQRSGFYFPVGSQELVGKLYYFQEFLIYFNKSYGFMLFILICAYSDGQLPNLSLQVRITFAFYEYTSLKLRIKNKNKITIKENYLKFLFLFYDRLDLKCKCHTSVA